MSLNFDCNQWPIGVDESTLLNCPANQAVMATSVPVDVFLGPKTLINLDSNLLTGTLDTLGEDSEFASTLISLSLSNNTLSGEIPASIGSLTKLQSLDLSFNALSGPIPSSFRFLADLTSLKLDGNAFDGCIPCPLQGRIDCSGIAGVLANGSNLLWCNTFVVADDNVLGVDTFDSSQEFIIVMASLAGGMVLLFICCLLNAIVLRRRRFLRDVIEGDRQQDPPPFPNRGGGTPPPPPLLPTQERRSSSARQGALSFDGREGWRSDNELRRSTRGSRTSSARD